MPRHHTQLPLKFNVFFFLILEVCSIRGLAQSQASDLVGTWQSAQDQSSFVLVLSADGSGSLNGNAIGWALKNGILSLALVGSQEVSKYKVALTPTVLTLTLPGDNTQPPRIFRRVDAQNAAGGGGSQGDFAFEATFPPGWTRHDVAGYRVATLHTDEYGTRDQTLLMTRAEPLQGSVEQTFAHIWSREIARGDGVQLVNPGLLSPERPQPLRRRLNNGLAVWYEGGEGKLVPKGNSCYVQLFMIPAGDSVTTVIAIYGMTLFGTSQEDRGPVMKFLESLRPSAPVPKADLFRPNDVEGNWEIMLVASLASFRNSSTGAYMGDASSGGMEDLALKPDGTYAKSFVGKTPTVAWTNQETGVWKLEDTILTLTPRKSSGKGPLQVERYRICGKGTFHGGEELLVESADSPRIPTDALESGATMEIAGHGGALLRFKAKAH